MELFPARSTVTISSALASSRVCSTSFNKSAACGLAILAVLGLDFGAFSAAALDFAALDFAALGSAALGFCALNFSALGFAALGLVALALTALTFARLDSARLDIALLDCPPLGLVALVEGFLAMAVVSCLMI